MAKKKFNFPSHVSKYPPNRKRVKEIKKELKKHIRSHYDFLDRLFDNIPYDDWYIGVTKKDDTGRKAGHKSKKGLEELNSYKSFTADTVSNARTVELELCSELKASNCERQGNICQLRVKSH